MPMIVDPDAPLVVPPVVVTSPDGWLSAAVDETWAGVFLAVDYAAGTPLTDAADVLQVRITRTDPDGSLVPVRSADLAWAIAGVGTAYCHEAPLGVAVIYTATPFYADGTTGPTSSLSVTVPAPAAPADAWIKSVDDPSLSARVTITSWPTLTWSSRIEAADIEGSSYPVTSQGSYAAAGSDISIDAEGAQIQILETLLTTPGVRLIQTDPSYRRADQFVLFADPAQGLDDVPTGARTYTASVTQVARPDTAGQPLRIPSWSWDLLAARYATWDAFAASYSTWASAAVDGVL